MKNVLRFFAGVALVALLSSCGPTEFKFPLSSQTQAVFDQELFGMWHQRQEGGDVFLLVGSSKEPNWMEFVFLIKGKSGEAEAMLVRAFPTKIGDKTYLNCILRGDLSEVKKESPEVFVLARYAVQDGHLKLWLTNDSVFDKALEKGILSGAEGKVTDSAENVVKFISSQETYEGEPLFHEFGEYQKVELGQGA